jgi:hypothetical protein
MKGTGKTMRERNEMTFYDNCKEVTEDFLHVGNWVHWDVLADAGLELCGLMFAVVFIAAFPITFPLAGYFRMKAARKRFQQEIDRQERVARMQSRVQKNNGESQL